MCSSQTGCTVNLPNVVLYRLSDDEVNKYVPQYRDGNKRSQPPDMREAKKLRLSSVRKLKKKKRSVNLPSIKLTNNSGPLTEKCSLKSNETISRKNRSIIGELTQISTVQTRLNTSTTKLSKNKEPSNKMEVTQNLTVKKRLNTSKKKLSKHAKPNKKEVPQSSTVKESPSTSKSKLPKHTKPSNKKYRTSCYISHKTIRNMSHNKNVNTNTQIRKKKMRTGKSYIKSKNVSKTCSDNNKETREERQPTPEPIIRTVGNEGESSDCESDSDIIIIEEVKKTICKIFLIKEEENLDGVSKLTREGFIENHIEKNKSMTINFEKTSPFIKQPPVKNSGKTNEDSKQCTTTKSQSKVKEVSTGLIKLKSPRSLGIVKQNESNLIDCSEKLKLFDNLIIDGSMVGQLCKLYTLYFNEYTESFIFCLIQTLKALLVELAHSDILMNFVCTTLNEQDVFDVNELAEPTIKYNDESANLSCDNMLIEKTLVQPPFKENDEMFHDLSANSMLKPITTKQNVVLNISPGDCTAKNIDVQPKLQGNIKLSEEQILMQKVLDYLTLNINQLDSKDFRSTLQNYSKDFVQTFTMLLDKFDKKHLKLMIPIVYMKVIKHLENSCTLKQECLWHIILKLFKIENFSCEYDEVIFKPWYQSEVIFSIYQRWLERFLKNDLYREVNNPYYQVNSEDVKKDLDFLNKTENSASKNNKSSSEIIVPLNNTSETREDLAIDKDLKSDKELKSDKGDLFEESGKEMCTEGIISPLLKKDLDFLNKTGNSANENNTSSSEIIVPLNNTSETQKDLAIDKDLKSDKELKSDKDDLFEESGKEMCMEGMISPLLKLQINDIEQDCLNYLCAKKIRVPCFYCKKLVSCPDLCQVNGDQIFSIATDEKLDQVHQDQNFSKIPDNVLVSCNLHKNIIKNYSFDKKCDFMLESVNCCCSKKLTVPCVFCMELVACEDLCQVDEDQCIDIETEEYTWKMISCKAHKGGLRNCDEVSKIEEHDMPYEPLCWRPECSKKSLIVCVCKSRSYCSDKCQEEDWFSTHYKDCKGRPQPDLIV